MLRILVVLTLTSSPSQGHRRRLEYTSGPIAERAVLECIAQSDVQRDYKMYGPHTVLKADVAGPRFLGFLAREEPERLTSSMLGNEKCPA